MAVSKVILNGETLIDVTVDTVTSSNLLSTYQATGADGEKITGAYVPPAFAPSALTVTPTETQQTFNAANVDGYKPVTVAAVSSTYVGTGVAQKHAADLTVNGSYVTAPIGYYSSAVSKPVAAGTFNTPAATFNSTTGVFTATASVTAGYLAASTKTSTYTLSATAANTITPTETAQTAISAGYYAKGAITVNPIPSEYQQVKDYMVYVGSGIGTDAKMGYPNGILSTLSALAGTKGFVNSGESLHFRITDGGTIYYNGLAVSGSGSTVNYYFSVSSTNLYVSGAVQSIYITDYIAPAGVVEATTITPGSTVQTAISAGYYAKGAVTVNAISSTYVGSGVTQRSASDLTISGRNIQAPSGYYPNAVSIQMDTGAYSAEAIFDSAIGKFTARALITSSGYLSGGGTTASYYQLSSVGAKTITPPMTTSSIAISAGYYAKGDVVVNPISEYLIYHDSAIRGTISESVFISSKKVDGYNDWKLVSVARSAALAFCTNITDVVYGYYSGVPAMFLYSCTRLSTFSTVSYSTTARTVGASAFYSCKSLTYVNISGIASIDISAFDTCNKLTEVIGPDIVAVYSNAFRSCQLLSHLEVSPNFSYIGDSAFISCSNLPASFLESLHNVTMVNAAPFTYASLLSSAKTFDFTKMKFVGSSAFYNFTYLSSPVYGPISYVGSSAFYRCSNIPYFSTTSSITRINTNAFYNCTSLSAATFNEIGGGISSSAFYACTSLKTFSATCISGEIGSQAFLNCTSLESITIYNRSYTMNIGSSAFRACEALSIAIFKPYSLSSFSRLSIQSNAFYNCYALNTIYLEHGSSATIDDSAFWGCPSLSSCYFITSDSSKYMALMYPMSKVIPYAGGTMTFYVPSVLLSKYQTAANWSQYSSRFVGLTDEEIAALPF